MDYNALKEKYNAEEIGDRLIAVVNGQREYIADKTPGGGFALTRHGMMLEQPEPEMGDAPAAEAAPVKVKRTRKAKPEGAPEGDVQPEGESAEGEESIDDLLADADAAQ